MESRASCEWDSRAQSSTIEHNRSAMKSKWNRHGMEMEMEMAFLNLQVGTSRHSGIGHKSATKIGIASMDFIYFFFLTTRSIIYGKALWQVSCIWMRF